MVRSICTKSELPTSESEFSTGTLPKVRFPTRKVGGSTQPPSSLLKMDAPCVNNKVNFSYCIFWNLKHFCPIHTIHILFFNFTVDIRTWGRSGLDEHKIENLRICEFMMLAQALCLLTTDPKHDRKLQPPSDVNGRHQQSLTFGFGLWLNAQFLIWPHMENNCPPHV